MTMVNIGVFYRDVPARVLEKIAVPPEMLGDMLARLHAVPSIDEVAVLSTCNRVEVYAAAHDPVERVAWAVAYLLARGRIPVGEVMRAVRVRVGAEAAGHVFSVASGLDSMAIGEEQIVAQIKAAARAAAEAGTKGPVVTGLLDAALRASKRARTDTTIGTAGISLARAGLGLAAAQLGGLAVRDAVVVGTGSMGKLAARLLREAGVARLSVASRREERAAGLAAAVDGMPLLIADLPVTLADADILVTATAGPAPAVLAAGVRQARARSGGRPLFVLDLGMPPNVDPAAGELAGVTLADITALGRHLADRAVPDQVARARGSSPRRPLRTPPGRTRRWRRRSSPRCTRKSGSSPTPSWPGCTTGCLSSATGSGPRRRRPCTASSARRCTGRPSAPGSSPPALKGRYTSRRCKSCSNWEALSPTGREHYRARPPRSRLPAARPGHEARTVWPAAAGHPRQSARAGPGRGSPGSWVSGAAGRWCWSR